MEHLDDQYRSEKVLYVQQVIHIVVGLENEEGQGREVIVHSNRRPIPIPYSEEP